MAEGHDDNPLTDVLDHSHRGDLVVTGARGDVSPITVLDEAPVGEALAFDTPGGPLGFGAGALSGVAAGRNFSGIESRFPE